MNLKDNIEKAKRKIGERIRAGYLGRILFLEILLAFLLVDSFPGYDIQRLIPSSLFGLIVALVYFLLINLARVLACRYLSQIFTKGGIELVLLGANFYLLKEIMDRGYSIGLTKDSWTLGLVAFTLFSLVYLGHNLWLFKWPKSWKAFPLTMGISLVLLFATAYFTLSQGFDRAPHQEVVGDYKNQAYPKTYPVEVLEYGPGEALDFGTESFSNRAYVSKWQARIRKKALGHGLGDAPYRGRIFLPKGKNKVPFILFVHGNHTMVEDNMGGYNYLGKFLASQGYGFVSIDQSVFNGYMGKGTGNENDARALSLLLHGEKLLEESKRKASPLYNRLSQDKLILGGHSRGGEAAAIAAHFNHLQYLPDEGKEKKMEALPIKGVLAVAPTYGQYLPSNRPVELEDVSYLLLHGTHDQDVNSMQGLDQYRYLTFTGQKGNFKAQVLVAGANHGLFNENWGRRDKGPLAGYYLNTKDLLAQGDQEKVLEVYALNFLRVVDKKAPSSLFMDTKALAKYLPKNRYLTRYKNDQARILANFEEDNRLETGSLPGVQVSGKDLSTWTEEAFITSGTQRSQDHVFYGYLGKEKGLKIEFPPKLARGMEGICLDVAFATSPNQIKVRVKDGEGQEAILSPSPKGIYGPEKTGLTKWQQLAQEWEDKNSLQTLAFPFPQVERENPRVDLRDLREIEVLSDPSGNAYLDDIGFYSFGKID